MCSEGFTELFSIYGGHDGFTDDEIVNLKKYYNKILHEARKKATDPTCFYCKKENTGLCNSHFVPKSYLKNIATDGKVYIVNCLLDIPIADIDSGLNNTGTFHLICRDCDGKIFRDYENFDYSKEPTYDILAQIELKNYLKYIYKSKVNYYKVVLTEEKIGVNPFTKNQKEIELLDIDAYSKKFFKIKKSLNSKHNSHYNLFYYKKLNYIVPVAFQCLITLAYDFNGCLINNIYNYSKNSNIEHIHICIFPLKETSIVMMFYNEKSQRYRNFRKQFCKFCESDQLSIINYIMFKYSEDIFFSKKIDKIILQNEELIKTARSTLLVESDIADKSTRIQRGLEHARIEFDLNKFSTIPNLLDEKFKIIPLHSEKSIPLN